MTRSALTELPVEELVERFASNGLQQDRAELAGESSKMRRLVGEMRAIQEELKSRPSDQRHALVALLDHPNMEVRLNAAKATVAIAPTAARNALETIAARRHYPQTAEARMTLASLDDGSWVPT